MKILFLCRGNVARSQMAEALFNKKWGGQHGVISAGTETSGPDQSLDSLSSKCQFVIDVLEEEGIDVRENIRKQLTTPMIDDADMVIGVFDTENELDKETLKESGVLCDIVWNVSDPKGMSLEVHRDVKNRIKELVEKMDI